MTIPSTATRLAALLTVNFLLVYTGFGLFAGIITPCFFAVDCLRSRERSVHLVALVAALLSGASFFLGYTVDPADDFELTSHAPRFMALMLANVCGVKGTGFLPTFIGVSVGITGLGIAGNRALAILRGTERPIDRTPGRRRRRGCRRSSTTWKRAG